MFKNLPQREQNQMFFSIFLHMIWFHLHFYDLGTSTIRFPFGQVNMGDKERDGLLRITEEPFFVLSAHEIRCLLVASRFNVLHSFTLSSSAPPLLSVHRKCFGLFFWDRSGFHRQRRISATKSIEVSTDFESVDWVNGMEVSAVASP